VMVWQSGDVQAMELGGADFPPYLDPVLMYVGV